MSLPVPLRCLRVVTSRGIQHSLLHRSSSEESFNYTRVSLAGDAAGDFRLSGLDKYTQYQVVVQAFNTRGEGPQSPVVIAQTLEDGKHGGMLAKATGSSLCLPDFVSVPSVGRCRLCL